MIDTYDAALYAERLDWKYGDTASTPGAHGDPVCRVCGAHRAEHIGEYPAHYCPVPYRMAETPPVPLSLDRAVIMHASNGKVDAYRRPPAKRSTVYSRERLAA